MRCHRNSNRIVNALVAEEQVRDADSPHEFVAEFPDTGSGLSFYQVETFCLFLGRITSRRMQLPLKRDVPKSPFGTNEQPPH